MTGPDLFRVFLNKLREISEIGLDRIKIAASSVKGMGEASSGTEFPIPKPADRGSILIIVDQLVETLSEFLG
jgi:hypothetical protein